MKFFKKNNDRYGIDMTAVDAARFEAVLDDFGFWYENLNPEGDFCTLWIEAPKTALRRLVSMFDNENGMIGPYKRS